MFFRCAIGPLLGALAALLLSVSVPQDAPAKEWRLLHIGEPLGELEPCGCSDPQIGGLPRLATLLRGFEPDPRAVAICNGDIMGDTDEQSRLKLFIFMMYYQALKFGAINLGEKDLAFGVEYLRGLERNHGVPLLCGNLTDLAGGRPFKGVTAREQGGGTLVIAGVISPSFAAELEAALPGYTVEPVAQTLNGAREMMGAEGVAVLLYHGPKEEARAVAKEYPWLSAVVYAHAGEHASKPEAVGTVRLVHAGSSGTEVGEAVLGPNGGARTYTLTPDYKDDPKTEYIRDVYLGALREGEYLERHPKTSTSSGATYVGSATCGGCHEDTYKLWEATTHSHAMKTLERVKHHLDPECAKCHSVGLDFESGFRTMEKTPELGNVGCESCHGPGSKHVEDYERPMKAGGEKSCADCHTLKNSPNFRFDEYWPKIKH